MDGLYGLGYGLGHGGAMALQGMADRPIYQAQVQGLNLQNQALQQHVALGQMTLAQQQAEQDALSHTAQPIENPLTPHDQQVADLQEAIKNVPQGQGLLRNKLMAQAVDLVQKQHVYQLGSATQSLLANNFDRAKQYMNAAGLKVQDVKPDPQGGYQIQMEGDDHPTYMSKQAVYALAQDPAQMQALSHNLMLNDQSMTMLGLRQTKQEQDAKLKRDTLNANIDRWKAMGEVQQQRADAATMSARASMSRAGTSAARLAQDLDQRFIQYATSPNGYGWDYGQAYTFLKDVRQAQSLGKDNEAIATQTAMKQYPAGHPFDQQQFTQLRDSIKQALDANLPPAVQTRNVVRSGGAAKSGSGKPHPGVAAVL